MAESGKTTKFIVLLVIIAGAVVFAVQMGCSSEEEPDWSKERQMELIDLKTLEPVIMTVGEWDSLEKMDKKGKNPNTGEYTVVPQRLCDKCRKPVPRPEFLVLEKFEPKPGRGSDLDPKPRSGARIPLAKAICPRCGGAAAIIPMP